MGLILLVPDSATYGGTKPITIGYLRSKGAKPIMIKDSDHKPLPSRRYRQIQGDNKPFDPSHLIGLAKHHIIFGANYFADKLEPSACWIVWLKKHEDWSQTTFADCELLWTDFDQHSRVYRIVWMGIIRQGDHTERVHPTQKPINLMAQLIEDFTEENSKILDPYVGSGSTLIASRTN